MAEYKLVVGTIKTLPEKVNECLKVGFVCIGDAFRTGNRIYISEYENNEAPEIAQPMINYYGKVKEKE